MQIFNLNSLTKDELVELIFQLFCQQDKQIFDCLQLDDISQVIDTVIGKIFTKFDWLDLYENEDDLLSAHHSNTQTQLQKFRTLFEKFIMLNPPHGESANQIIEFILYNPENDLRQKILSQEFNVSTPYFSMIFSAQTGLHYVDYISTVKLMRSAWLLKNTSLKINEIATRMYYKDIAYFSRQFKTLFHITPSEYRIPDYYQFEI